MSKEFETEIDELERLVVDQGMLLDEGSDEYDRLDKAISAQKQKLARMYKTASA